MKGMKEKKKEIYRLEDKGDLFDNIWGAFTDYMHRMLMHRAQG